VGRDEGERRGGDEDKEEDESDGKGLRKRCHRNDVVLHTKDQDDVEGPIAVVEKGPALGEHVTSEELELEYEDDASSLNEEVDPFMKSPTFSPRWCAS
jgi:hypothetical protein